MKTSLSKSIRSSSNPLRTDWMLVHRRSSPLRAHARGKTKQNSQCVVSLLSISEVQWFRPCSSRYGEKSISLVQIDRVESFQIDLSVNEETMAENHVHLINHRRVIGWEKRSPRTRGEIRSQMSFRESMPFVSFETHLFGSKDNSSILPSNLRGDSSLLDGCFWHSFLSHCHDISAYNCTTMRPINKPWCRDIAGNRSEFDRSRQG